MGIIQTIVDFLFVTVIGGVISFFQSKWTRKKIVLVLGLVLLTVWFFAGQGEESVMVPTNTIPEVVVSRVSDLTQGGAFSITGAVEAMAEAQLKAESGGRVTAVNTEIGKFVSAGSVIAALDNAPQRAALLQAQGAYEAALAASRQGEVGVAEAATALDNANRNAVTSFSSAYNTVSSVVRTTVDNYFSNPTSPNPGLRINGMGNTGAINASRVALESSLFAWQGESARLTAAQDVTTSLEAGRRYAREAVTLIDSLIAALERDTGGNAADDLARSADITTLSAARGTILGTESSLQGAIAGINAAKDAKARAEITAGNSGPTTNSAALTQALGALRAAQAQYEKTLVRTPISGVVNALYIKRGDFVAPQADAAVVANNNGKQVTSAITESDSETIKIGDPVRFDGVATGTVTAIAGAVDPKTGKIAIKMSVANPELLTTGTNVAVTFGDAASSTVLTDGPIVIPLTAVKLMADSAVVYTVGADSKLEARTVTLGRVLGDSIVVTEGLERTTEIVVDVRGLKAGELVTIKN
jgi:multidrug efflux pump subunit AcrA (membrane-fusion protein)